MLQYLPFLLRDKLPVALEGTELKPLHQQGWRSVSEPPHLSQAVPHGAMLGRGWKSPPFAAGLGFDSGKVLLRRFILTISLPTAWGQAGRNHHPVPHPRGLLPLSSVGTPSAPAGPREGARSQPRGSSGVGCWSRFRTAALNWSLSIRANVPPLLYPSFPLAAVIALSTVSSPRKTHSCSTQRHESPPAKQIF